MRSEIRIVYSLALAFGLSLAHPFPQNGGQQNQNTYLPQGNPGQAVTQGFQQFQQTQQQSLTDPRNTFGGSEEILNLTPPGLIQGGVAAPPTGDVARAVAPPATSQEVDSYSNVRLNSNPGGLNIASALVNSNNNNPHEYGETVPGAFSNLDSYAAYQNYQGN